VRDFTYCSSSKPGGGVAGIGKLNPG